MAGKPLSNNIQRLALRLYPESAADLRAFLDALAEPSLDTRALLWFSERPDPSPFDTLPALSWQPECVDRLAGDQQAGRHPLHAAGAYYCLDMSSVFAGTLFACVPTHPALVIDVCASPGGKSALAYRLLQPQMLVSNETIGKRLGALISNLDRCHIKSAAVTCHDPAVLATLAPGTADLVIVDAPCSGQSLIAKGKEAPGAFHPATINLNANRQRRILAQAASLVRPGGHLAYITCTYSEKENEGNLSWFLKRFPNFTAMEVPLLACCQSHLTDTPAYRLWPQSGEGAGAFATLLRNMDEGDAQFFDLEALRPRWRSPDAD